MDEKEKQEFFGEDDDVVEQLDEDNMDMFMKNSKNFFKRNKKYWKILKKTSTTPTVALNAKIVLQNWQTLRNRC